jgi:hypothetical protein
LRFKAVQILGGRGKGGAKKADEETLDWATPTAMLLISRGAGTLSK